MIEETGQRSLIDRARELATAAESLATRLKREEEVARLRAMCSVILERLRREKELEMCGHIGSNLAGGAFSLVRLVAGLATMRSENPTVQAISQGLLAQPDPRETPFGTVLVRVGLRGVPESVEVINISDLARRSEKDEGAVIERLVMQGNLLCDEEAFSGLIERLADDILKGEQSLPVSPQRLYQLQERRPLRLNPGNSD